jgi:putative redox protein
MDLLPKRMAMGEGAVVVTTAPHGKVAQEIRAGHHTLLADEPTPIGDDTGPTPYDLLLAALGSCTAMTVELYARRKEWPLDQAAVRLSHTRAHADDSRDCATAHCMIERIDLVLELRGALTDEQRRRLVEVAERCPVHRTLIAETQIITRLATNEKVVDDLAPSSPV